MATDPVRLKSISGFHLSPVPPAKGFALHGAALFFPQPVAFSAERIDLGEHPSQQGFGRQCVYPGPLKPKDILPLAGDLGAHPLDFGSELVKLHHVLAWLGLFQSADVQPPSGDPPFPEVASDSII
jgi:hypothetical protein